MSHQQQKQYYLNRLMIGAIKPIKEKYDGFGAGYKLCEFVKTPEGLKVFGYYWTAAPAHTLGGNRWKRFGNHHIIPFLVKVENGKFRFNGRTHRLEDFRDCRGEAMTV